MSAGTMRDEQARLLGARQAEGLPGLAVITRRPDTPPLSVAALCEDYGDVCESAVDPLEIASALEFGGMSDLAARERYGYHDVFALAREMYIQVPRQPAEPPAPEDPWQVSRAQPLLHALLYGLPAVCFPAATVLLAGPGAHVALIVALLASWAASQGLASLGYQRLGRTTDRDQARRVLRAGLLAALAAVALVLGVTAAMVHARLPVLAFGAGEAVYMLGACVLLVLGAERWLLAVLAPGVLGSTAFLVLGRPPGLDHAVWATLAATPVLALVAAAICTRGAGRATGRLLDPVELRNALPAVVFGVLAAGLLAFPVVTAVPGPAGAGAGGAGAAAGGGALANGGAAAGVNTGALLATLPLSLSMGAAEWSLLRYRRRTRDLLRSTRDLRAFGRQARLALLAALSQYLLAAVVLTAAATWIAIAVGLVRPDGLLLPELAVYLALGGAMFLALTLQALGVRAVPLAACAGALAFELAWRQLGLTAQLAACVGLLVVLGGYAVRVLAMAVRHSF